MRCLGLLLLSLTGLWAQGVRKPVVTLPTLTLTEPDLLRFAHDEPALLLGVQVRTIVDSPMVQSLTTLLPVAGAPGMLDSLRQVERIYVSVGTTATQQMDVVVLLKGDFRRGIPQFLRESSMALFRVNANTLLAGDARGARAAYARLQRKDRRAIEAQSGDLWLVADKSLLPAGATMPAALRDLLRVNASVVLTNGVSFDLSLLTTSPEAAERLLAELRTKMKEMPPTPGLDQQVDIRREGALARITASVTQAQLEAGMSRDWKSLLNGATPVVAAAPAPRKPVIHGQ